MFSGRHQHDTQEFLRYFMIIMNEELQELEVAPIICHSNKSNLNYNIEIIL